MEHENKMNISKRAFVRIISYLIAAALVLGALAVQQSGRADNAQMMMQYSYMRAVEDLSLSMDNIKNTLSKGLYSNSPKMLSQLTGKLANDASTAKVALSQLPVEELNLEQTYKFLSQVGNYSQSLAEKFSRGEELTGNERENLRILYSYAESLSNTLWNVEKQLEAGEMNFEKAASAASYASGNGAEPATVTEGFTEFEEGFEDYPTLIYDGPFSDHIMEKNPLMTKGKAEISAEEALGKAVSVSGINSLYAVGEEGGKMPSYVFEGEGASVSVTKNGGYFCYMVKYRPVGERAITVENALKYAHQYMERLGIDDDITDTYYEISNGVCIFNFAGEEDDVTLYTDLIKIGVAMDNGEIMSFDARGYLTNHTDRDIDKPAITAAQAQARLSETLNVKSVSMALIPSSGQNEVFCYEFSCTDPDGRQILVYINAHTGEEEEILLLQISSDGKLTV